MEQNALGQSDCRIFQSILYLEQNDDIAWNFFACWYKFMEIKGWLKNIGVGGVKNGCGLYLKKELMKYTTLIFCMVIQI